MYKNVVMDVKNRHFCQFLIADHFAKVVYSPIYLIVIRYSNSGT
jgi:hypothetical protein